MVSIEFEKPSEWTIGKKVGILAAICLLLGGLLSFSICYPILTIFLIVFLFYLKFDIYLEKEKDATRMKINHFILIAWGALHFVLFILQAILWTTFMSDLRGSFFRIISIGLWLITLGFLLCIIAGLLEWKYPAKAGPKVRPIKKEAAEPTPTAAQPTPVVTPQVEPEKEAPAAADIEKVPVEKEPVKSKPARAKPVKAAMLETTRESATEEEKALMRWARHINKDGQTFEQCIRCKEYVFVEAKDSGDSITFTCPKCNGSFILKK